MDYALTFKVFDLNNGSLILTVSKGDEMVYAHHYDGNRIQQAVEDVRALVGTDSVSGWDGNELEIADNLEGIKVLAWGHQGMIEFDEVFNGYAATEFVSAFQAV